MLGWVYILCGLTSLTCAALLLRGYWRTGVRLLLWTGLCFVGLGIDNMILYVDLVLTPDIDISAWRRLPGVIALMVLIFGLVWDS